MIGLGFQGFALAREPYYRGAVRVGLEETAAGIGMSASEITASNTRHPQPRVSHGLVMFYSCH